MPQINKPEKKPRPERKETDMRKLRRIAYNDTRWRKERDTFLKEHPLCDDCLAKGKITPATSIHHKKSPFSHGEINWTLLYDWDNLMSLCHECHGERHAKEQGHVSAEDILKQLDDLFNDNIKDEDLEQ